MVYRLLTSAYVAALQRKQLLTICLVMALFLAYCYGRNNLRRVGVLAEGARGNQIVLRDGYALIAADGLSIFDLAQPNEPRLVATQELPTIETADMAVVGDYVYLVDGEGLAILDVSTLQAPQLIAYEKIDGVLLSIAVHEHYAFVAAGYRGLLLFDVADPRHPVQLDLPPLRESVSAVAIIDHYLYVSTSLPAQFAYLQIFDITDPPALQAVGGFEVGDDMDGIAVQGNLGYMATFTEGLKVVDITDPTSPVLLGVYNTPGYARDVAVRGNYAYVADNFSLRVIDVSNPAQMREVATYKMKQARGIALDEQHVYVTDLFTGLNIFTFTP